jgi:ornithine cyclodeaminase
MTVEPALWIDEEHVAAHVSLIEAIDIVQQGFASQARGEIETLGKRHVAWPGGGLYALGAVSAKAGFAATKTWAQTATNTTPLLVLFDRENGSLRAVIEAYALGQLRTAAVSAVATRWLAAPDAGDLAMLGTGRQAFPQVAAMACIRRLRRVRVWSPNVEHRKAFVAHLRAELSREVIEADSLAQALDGAPIVTVATRATEAFVEGAMLAPGVHVNAIGAITAECAELGSSVLERATRVVVDELPVARRLSRELAGFYGESDAAWKGVETLAQVVAGARARTSEKDVTVFKALGSGLSDLVLGLEVFQRVLRAGGGREIPQPERVRPRLLPGGID